MGGGSTSYRPSGGNEARAGDLLPTAELLTRLKALAWDRAQAKAFAVGWPLGEAGLAILGMSPVLAMKALNVFCPAPVGRLAAWLRLDPREAAIGWNLSQSNGWVAETAADIVRAVEGQGA